MRIPLTAVRVLDQQEALDFYTRVLGFSVKEDMDLGNMRWLTVSPPDQPDLEVLLEGIDTHPMYDEASKEMMRTLLAKGFLQAVFLDVDDCRATFDDLLAEGVDVIQEPMERFYGIDAAIRDNSGNHIRITQRVETGVPVPDGV